ncbi:hypothetical protein cypCar_00041017 [Cyprinus carpio]|nr:hypothetical protein cypCar_00041017 [Cyprinus carpio]
MMKRAGRHARRGRASKRACNRAKTDEHTAADTGRMSTGFCRLCHGKFFNGGGCRQAFPRQLAGRVLRRVPALLHRLPAALRNSHEQRPQSVPVHLQQLPRSVLQVPQHPAGLQEQSQPDTRLQRQEQHWESSYIKQEYITLIPAQHHIRQTAVLHVWCHGLTVTRRGCHPALTWQEVAAGRSGRGL